MKVGIKKEGNEIIKANSDNRVTLLENDLHLATQRLTRLQAESSRVEQETEKIEENMKKL